MERLITKFFRDTEYSKGNLELEVADKIPIANSFDSLVYQIEIYVNILMGKTDLILIKSYNRDERNRPVTSLHSQR